MKVQAGIVDLDRLALSSGEAARIEFPAELETVRLGEESYAMSAGQPPARLDVSRTGSGYALRLRLDARLTGPCVRCLQPADLELEIDAREVDQPGTADEELRSPYVAEGRLDVGRWAQDAVVLALPSKPLCRADCAGLCPVCGESLNDTDPEAHHHASSGDPRLAKLRDLKLE